jgi:hypothetical protein
VKFIFFLQTYDVRPQIDEENEAALLLKKISKIYFSKKPIFINDFQGINYLNIKIE